MPTTIGGLVLLATLALTAMTTHAQAPAYVTRVVDGHTIYVETGGQLEVVRYLGVNTPRIEDPRHGPERYADAAREVNRRLVDGKWVQLRFDGPPRDRHGRLLAYVWVGDVFVNAMLVHRGYGEAAVASSAGYAEYFRMLQDGAVRDGRGVWREPDAQAHHRPRPTELAADDEQGSDVLPGRVFSAPAPFFPPLASPTSSRSSFGVPAGPSSPGSPSYIAPRGSTGR